MSLLDLFVIGVLITLIVTVAMALLIYAAVQDGRYEAECKRAAEQQAASETDHVALSAA